MPCGYLSLLYSTSNKPLEYWSKQKSRTGSIQRVLDEELNENVLEIQDIEENYQKTWIMCPPEPNQVLNIKLSFLVIVIKCRQFQCLLQLQLIDKDNIKHLINFSNVEPRKVPNPKNVTPRMHFLLEPGWNKLEIDLGHLSKIFETQFEAVSRLKICANCRIRRIYFTDKHYNDDELPNVMFQGFLDYYMLKWGIKSVDRETQTKKTFGKSLVRDSLHPTSGFSKLFLRNLQAKSDKIIEDFFSHQSIKSIKECLDFKKRARIKPYVIPDGNRFYKRKTSSSESSLIDLDEFKKTSQEESHIYSKLAIEDKNSKTEIQACNNDKQDIKQSASRLQKYKFPEVINKKFLVGKDLAEQLLPKHPSLNKLRTSR